MSEEAVKVELVERSATVYAYSDAIDISLKATIKATWRGGEVFLYVRKGGKVEYGDKCALERLLDDFNVAVMIEMKEAEDKLRKAEEVIKVLEERGFEVKHVSNEIHRESEQ